MKQNLLAPALHALPMAIEPGFQVIVVVGQPSSPAPYVCCMGQRRHEKHVTQRPTISTREAAFVRRAPAAAQQKRTL
jgi:hypothetical protein